MIRELLSLFACFVFLVYLVFWQPLPEPPAPAHEHEPVHYRFRARIQTDTLCRTDTLMIYGGHHRPVPEMLRPIIWEELRRPQPIVDEPKIGDR